jgi:transcriptional regulator with XRE-family HTH domain
MPTLSNGSDPTTLDNARAEYDMAYRRDVDPTASAAALYAYKLRMHRDAKGWTQDALADRAACTGDLISKIETAKRSATLEMSQHFDRLFGLDAYFEELQPLAARELALGWFRPFLEAEAAAKSLHIFEPTLITGLLQTEEYARAIIAPGKHPDEIEQLTSARMARQEILRRDEPPWLVILLAEYAVRRMVGGSEVMGPQLERLLDAIREPNVTLQIVPDDAPIYLSMPFTLMGFHDGRDMAYAETGGIPGGITREYQYVERLKVHFDLIRAAALPCTASERVIRTRLEGI